MHHSASLDSKLGDRAICWRRPRPEASSRGIGAVIPSGLEFDSAAGRLRADVFTTSFWSPSPLDTIYSQTADSVTLRPKKLPTSESLRTLASPAYHLEPGKRRSSGPTLSPIWPVRAECHIDRRAPHLESLISAHPSEEYREGGTLRPYQSDSSSTTIRGPKIKHWRNLWERAPQSPAGLTPSP